MRRALPALALAALVALPGAAAAQARPGKAPKGQAAAAAQAPPAGSVQRLDDLSLTVTVPEGLKEQKRGDDPQVRAAWAGKLGASEVRLLLILLPQAEFGFGEPSQVLTLIGRNLADPTSGGDPAFRFEEVSHHPGPFGWASYATLGASSEREGVAQAQVLRLTGLLPDHGYALELRAQPALDEAGLAAARDALLRGTTWEGEPRDPRWAEDEALARWREDAPDALADELEDVLRTDHYLILTNSSGGRAFAKKMEECHAAIRKVFPFEEVEGRRLLPVFLFRTNDQYFEFFAKAFDMSVEDGRRTGGVASGDFYATWYEAPGDPVHIHEATHQIFANRLELGGGGSWFQEGVAEYMSTKANERGMAATAVEKGRSVPLAEFVRVPSLVFSAPSEDLKGENQAGNQYKQAALLIEFLRESKWGKAGFLDFVHAVGAVPRNHVGAIEGAIRRVYDTDLAGLEREFVAYCKKR